MRFITKLSMLMLCATVLFTGCEQQMRKPVMEVILPPPTQSPLEKAQAAMEEVNQRRTETHQKAEAAGDFSITIFTDSENIFIEELGFTRGFWVKLVEIYRNENSKDTVISDGFTKLQDAFAKKLEEDTLGMFYFEYIRTFDPLIVEYLRLSYEFPDENEAALLTRFGESVRDAKVSIVFPENFR